MTQGEAAKQIGVSVQYLGQLAKKEPDLFRPREWNAKAVAGAIARIVERSKARKDSTADKDEWKLRNARALALKREREASLLAMREERARGSHVSVDDIEQFLAHTSAILRKAAERMQRQFGPELATLWNEMLDELDESWQRRTFKASSRVGENQAAPNATPVRGAGDSPADRPV